MKISDCVKLAAVVVVLAAGSCATPQTDSFADPLANYPITVNPVTVVGKFTAPAPAAELPPDEAARFGALVADYLETGKGDISVSVPQGPDSTSITAYFGEKLASLGIARTRIAVGSHDAQEDMRVHISYLTYAASSPACGNWSRNTALTWDNQPSENFGCATQHNIAAQVADPRDFAVPRAEDGASGARRADVLDKYRKGSKTASEKSSDQSAKISDVGDSNSGGN